MITTNPIEPSSLTVKQKFNKQNNLKAELPVNLFNDFFSIGADAKIALDFHLARG